MKNRILYCLLALHSLALAQVPNLGLRVNTDGATEAYTLFSPEKATSVCLVDACGELVNEWTFGENPGLTVYLLDNGNLLRAGKDTIQIRTWENDPVWSFAINSQLGINQHHDIELLPNGNILCIITDWHSSEDMHNLGKDTVNLPGRTKLDKIVELSPIGLDSAEVVWEWRFVDHLVQDFDSTKPGYGVIANNPHRLDINYPTAFGDDLTHVNSIDYNPFLDQIILSARSLDEILIIDHSTTTQEAASSVGGSSNKGGDFLWRWGNPLVYDQGTPSDQKLRIQHDAKWVPEGYADAGMISVFNNGGDSLGSNESSIVLIDPIIINGTYEMQQNRFLPVDFEWSWKGDVLGETVYEGKKSGAHMLPNGNVVFSETSKGQISEISRVNNEILWVYKNPLGSVIYNQEDTIQNSNNSIFRGERYMPNHPGLVGKDLSPVATLEDTNALSTLCKADTATSLQNSEALDVYFQQPLLDNQLRFTQHVNDLDIALFDLMGRLVMDIHKFNGKVVYLDLSPGIYIVKFGQGVRENSSKLIIP